MIAHKQPCLIFAPMLSVFTAIVLVINVNCVREIRYKPKTLYKGTIYFLDTSDKDYTVEQLNSRQACSFESAAKSNPDLVVKVLLLSQIDYGQPLFDLLKRQHVIFETINLDNYFNNTPLHWWWKRGFRKELYDKKWHLSDVLRIVTVWKYGGYYLDTDIIVTKPLSDLGCNWIGFERDESRIMNGAAMCFDRNQTGKTFTSRAMKEIKNSDYRRGMWGLYGPRLIARVMEQLCGPIPPELVEPKCRNIRVLPKHYFHPIHFTNWHYYFSPEHMGTVKDAEENAYGFHIWNKFSAETSFNPASSPYGYLEQKYCPGVNALAGNLRS